MKEKVVTKVVKK